MTEIRDSAQPSKSFVDRHLGANVASWHLLCKQSSVPAARRFCRTTLQDNRDLNRPLQEPGLSAEETPENAHQAATDEPHVDSRADAHELIVLATLQRLCVALIVVYALVAAAAALWWTPNSLPVLASTFASAGMLAVGFWALGRRKIPAWAANPAAAVVATAAFLHLLVLSAYLPSPLFEPLLILCIGGLGFLILSPRWLVAAVAATSGSWGWLAWSTSVPGDRLEALAPILVGAFGATTLHWARLTRTRPLRDALANAEDRVAELRATEHALRVKHRQYRSIFEEMIDGLTLRSLEQGRLVDVNPAVAEMLGYSRQELLELDQRSFVHPDSMSDFVEMLDVVGRGERYPFSSKLIHRDGSVLDVEGCFIPFGFDTEPMALGIVKDVTERKAALARLSASEERYRTLVEDQTEFVVRWTPDGVRTFVNQAYCRYLGEAKKDLLGKSFFPEEDEPERLDILRKLEDWDPQDPPVTTLQLFRRDDGTQRWLEWSDRAVFDEAGRIKEIQSIGRDVHERVTAEQRQHASDLRFRLLFEHSPDAIFVESESGVILDVNPAACRLHGSSREELVGSDIDVLVPGEATPEMRAEFQQLVAGTKTRVDSLGRTADGRAIQLSLTARRIEYEGQPALLVHARDISDQHAVSEALRHSEEKYRRLFEQTNDAVVITDANRTIEDANPAALSLFGFDDLEEFLAADPVSLYESPEERQKLIDRLDESGEVEDLKLQMTSKGGRRFTALTSVAILLDGNGEVMGYRTILRDVTESQRLQRQLRQAQKMEAAGRLAGGLAHDFNNMLTVIGGYAYLGLQEDESGPFAENFTQIHEATQRATDLTSQLLAFSRQQELKPKRVSLNDIISGFESLLRGSVTEDILLEVALDPDLGMTEVDPGQIEQVLMNLAVNAGHAMPNGGKLIIQTRNADFEQAYRDSGGTLKRGEYVALVVSDTGCGMDEATRTRVFEPFFTTRKEGQGTGLGLSTAYGIIQQSGGSIAVYSEVGQGTVFKIYLPRVASVPKAVADVQTTEAEAVESKPTILITDDDPGVRSLLANALSRDGMIVLTADSAREARETIEGLEAPVDLLLSDLVLPEENGVELATFVRSRYPDVAVVLMSGYPEKTIKTEYQVPDGVAFLGKPFKITEVSKLISRSIAEARETGQAERERDAEARRFTGQAAQA